MSEWGAGITVRRNDGKAVTEEEATKLVDLMEIEANQAGKHGSFDDGEADCGLGWDHDDGSYTLVATTSAAYKFGLPEDLAEASMQDDIEYAKWLTTRIEKTHPRVYAFEITEEEW